MRRSQAMAMQKRALNLPVIWIDMCLTYTDELILAQIEDSCSGEHQANLARKSKQPPTDRTSSCSSGNGRRHFLYMAPTMPAYMHAQVKVHVVLYHFIEMCRNIRHTHRR